MPTLDALSVCCPKPRDVKGRTQARLRWKMLRERIRRTRRGNYFTAVPALRDIIKNSVSARQSALGNSSRECWPSSPEAPLALDQPFAAQLNADLPLITKSFSELQAILLEPGAYPAVSHPFK